LNPVAKQKRPVAFFPAIRPIYFFYLKTLPIKDTFFLYRDYLYAGLMFLPFLILSRVKVNKKAK